MTKVIFRFDTEDFVNEKAADGILRVIRVLEEFGVRGCFAVTARKRVGASLSGVMGRPMKARVKDKKRWDCDR